MRQELNDRLKEIYVGEKEENQLVYDFGYYLGSEEMDEMFKYAAQYVSQDKETESSFLNELEDSLQSRDGGEFYKQSLLTDCMCKRQKKCVSDDTGSCRKVFWFIRCTHL